MLKEILVILNVSLFSLFMYGIYNHLRMVEPNSCEMTYMFDMPKFTKIHVTRDENFSNYGLYFYSEGRQFVNVKSLNGAPVLFVPGNGGSYKQVRSLASVALQMAMQSKNHIHMNYFTIDYGEELSAFFGGYLEKQKQFLKSSIRAIEKIYKNSDMKIVIIAHSMGGIVAKSILGDDDFINRIGSIIFLSTPLDHPVINIDLKMNEFYENINQTLVERQAPLIPVIEIDRGNVLLRKELKNEVLLISIGGGNRDLEVPAWLTTSPFSDIHTMTSAIPNVWLSCDHLSIVWCLQLMKVVNKFLFSIARRQPNNYVVFQRDLQLNFISAYKYFVSPSNRPSYEFAYNDNSHLQETWHVAESRHYQKTFGEGLQKTYNEMIPLNNYAASEIMFIEVSQSGIDDWLFGCIADEMEIIVPVCQKIYSLANHIAMLPAKKTKKSFALLDVQYTAETHTNWTHILIRMPMTKHAVSLKLDIFDPNERYVNFQSPNWLDFTTESINYTTVEGAAYMKLEFENSNPPYLAAKLNMKKMECSANEDDITIKASPSWVAGFDEYFVFRANEQEKNIIINPPVESGKGTKAVVDVELFLDPNCRLIISQQLSFQHTLKRVIQRYIALLPAHLIAIAIIILAQDSTIEKNLLTCALKGAFQYESWLIAVGCYLLQFYYQNGITSNILYELIITVLVHAAALITSVIISLSLWALLVICARLLIISTPQLSKILQFLPSNLMSTTVLFWITFAIIGFSGDIVTCSSMRLFLSCHLYFLWLSTMYKELLLKWQEVPKASGSTNNLPAIEYIDMNDFLMHFKLLQLLVILTSLNFGEIVAWFIKYPISEQIIPLDQQSISNILLIISWFLLWRMENIACFLVHKTLSLVLYGIAVICFFYCQEKVFIINYVVASAYTTVLVVCLIHKTSIRYF